MIKDWSKAGKFRFDEPLSAHTTFKIGGPCKVMLFPSTVEEIAEGIRLAKKEKLPYFILGNGSNFLVPDEGYPGVAIHLGEDFSKMQISGNRIRVQAGALMPTVAQRAYRAGLSGLEFASGIPGSIGGGVTMNAGAYGGEMKQVVEKVLVMDDQGRTFELNNEDMDFHYRHSCIQDHPWIILEVVFHLEPDQPEAILGRMEEFTRRRKEKQPLEYPSAGSTFKRPEGYFAGKLVDDTGLRGFRYKDAMVSEKHCGFIINAGNADFEQVITLIHMVQKLVYDKYGVLLEREVKILGEK